MVKLQILDLIGENPQWSPQMPIY